MWKYSEKLMEHFMNPRNVGEISEADGHSEVGSPQCGDAMTLDIMVGEDEEIVDVRFRTFGCAAAIASASAMTEMVKGEKIGKALELRNKDIADYLGGMPPEKFHCSVMGREALTTAVADYISRRDEVDRAARELLSNLPDSLPTELSGASIARVHSRKVSLVSEKELSAESLGALSIQIEARVSHPVEVIQVEER